MSEPIVYAENLTKIYRLYSKPHYRFLDMFGLLGKKPEAYTEHKALDGINLEIQRGEKVAIIGRNGAGKSTFLKLVTNVTKPTAGRLVVKGKAHALLQIGTGFHPDFTGRENVYAYLAQLGATGRAAKIKCAEIIEFAELEEYIDQPVKTYSTGMAMRLMFSTSTAISPNLLVLDEVLGVGDAYFAQKSYERIQGLCEGEGTTLLLVSHDVYSASRICDRMIWIDRGHVLIDGDPSTVVKAYEDSIRVQEEHRLRLRTQAKVEALQQYNNSRPPSQYIFLEIQAKNNQPQKSLVYFSHIELLYRGEKISAVSLKDTPVNQINTAYLEREHGCWGDAISWQKQACYPMLNYGSPFHKATVVFPFKDNVINLKDIQFFVNYWMDESCFLKLSFIFENKTYELGYLPVKTKAWINYTTSFEKRTFSEETLPGVQGTGDIILTKVLLVNEKHEEVYQINHGQAISLLISYKINRTNLKEKAQVLVIISRNNTERVCKFLNKDITFSQQEKSDGMIEMYLSRMMLSRGVYSIAVEIVREGYIEKQSKKFFSIDEDVYYCISNAYEFSVTDSGWIGENTIFEGEATWFLK
jgi:ABC-type polysaccharide/polyol phosphate transport system ATPase subunit